MATDTRKWFLDELAKRAGGLRRLDNSRSLFELGDGRGRIYIRYSKVHSERSRAWYGLRAKDLLALEGRPSLICFLWEGQKEPLLVPYSEYEHVFQSTTAAADGQYKAYVILRDDGTQLYIAQAGRFNVESHLGWGDLDALLQSARACDTPDLTHAQVQTLLGAIGAAKGYDVWVPLSDRFKLDWSLAERYECPDRLPVSYKSVWPILQEIDVVWTQKGSGQLRALYEVEHSTPIYSGLLRFNDIHLAAPSLKPSFGIVANDSRRDVFVRQLNRPTFQVSGLSELCSFLEYVNVYSWHKRTVSNEVQTVR
jgi:hypothetical protein